MRKLMFVSFVSFAALACSSAPPPVETAPPAPVDAVTAALGGHEGAFAIAGEWFPGPDQPPVAFTATAQQWFGDDGVFYEVYDQAVSETSGPGMQGWGKMWFDEASSEARMWWTDTMAPGVAMEMTGSVAEDGTITLDGVGPGPDGAPTHYRSIYRLPEGAPDVFEMGVVLSDGTFMLMMKYTTTRTGDAVKTWTPPAPAAPAPIEAATPPVAP